MDFENFLVERNDEIDNATWEFCISVLTNCEDAKQDFHNAVAALQIDPDGYTLTAKLFDTQRYEDVCDTVKKLAEEHGFERNEDNEPEWNMAIIGEAIEAIQHYMDAIGLASCHPFWSEDESGICTACWSAEEGERCENCPYYKAEN